MFGAYIVRHRVVLLMLAGVIAASLFLSILFVTRTAASSVLAYTPQTVVMQQMLQMTNDLRQQYGLPELIASNNLKTSAQNKLEDMRKSGYWGHYNPNGTSFSRFIWDQNTKAATVGENLARCFDDYAAAFDGLVASPTHFAVLTGDFTYIGVASEVTANGCESIVMHVSD